MNNSAPGGKTFQFEYQGLAYEFHATFTGSGWLLQVSLDGKTCGPPFTVPANRRNPDGKQLDQIFNSLKEKITQKVDPKHFRQ